MLALMPSQWAWLTQADLAATSLIGHGRLLAVLTCPERRQGPLKRVSHAIYQAG